jgi:hypothetical protein
MEDSCWPNRAQANFVLVRLRGGRPASAQVPETMGYACWLYLEMGFRPCDRYNENPVEGLTWMVKSF